MSVKKYFYITKLVLTVPHSLWEVVTFKNALISAFVTYFIYKYLLLKWLYSAWLKAWVKSRSGGDHLHCMRTMKHSGSYYGGLVRCLFTHRLNWSWAEGNTYTDSGFQVLTDRHRKERRMYINHSKAVASKTSPDYLVEEGATLPL